MTGIPMGKSFWIVYHVMCTMPALRTYDEETDMMDDKTDDRQKNGVTAHV